MNGSNVPQASAQQAGQSYTAEEVEARLLEERKAFQRRLVKEQQARREAEQAVLDNRRQLQDMDARFRGFQQQLESVAGNRGSQAPDDDSEVDWDNISTGKDIRRAIRAEAKSLLREQGNVAPGTDDEVAQEVWALRLERMESGLRAKYQGINEEQIRQVLNTAYDSGIGDLEYAAHKILGPADKFIASGPQDDDLDDLQDDARSRARANTLAGRSALQAAQSGPKTVQLRRHQPGHADAEKAAREWADTRGRGR